MQYHQHEDNDDIPYWIARRLNRYGFIHVSDNKWKFSEVRVYVRFGLYYISDLIPTSVLNNINWHFNKKRREEKEDTISTKLWWSFTNARIPSFIGKIIIPYQKWVYKRVYRAALKKWPCCADSIKNGADYHELI